MSVNDDTILMELLEAGVHFGHQTSRWNPKMKSYIYGNKNGVYIIDLEKTKDLLKEASQFMRDVARAGSYILFVGTKKQAQTIIKDEAIRSGMFYVNERWLGGTLTNFSTIRKSIKKLEKLESMKTDGTYEKLSKKERSDIDKQKKKLNRSFEGIRKMDRLPGAIFVVDSKKEDIAIKEAKKLSVKIVALVDTNSDPTKIDYLIPGNDDAIKSVSLITKIIADSAIEGRDQYVAGSKAQEEEKKKAMTESSVKEEVEELIEGDIRLKEVEKEKEKNEQTPKKKKTESKGDKA